MGTSSKENTEYERTSRRVVVDDKKFPAQSSSKEKEK